jgi:thiol:disulfide interchange protein DsbA
MIRPLALTALLALSVCACGAREAPTPQRTAAAPAQPIQTSPQPQSSSAAQSGTPAPQSETEQAAAAAAAQESAGDSGEEERSQTRSDVTLERLAALPPDAQLPSGRWKPGVNYDPLVPAQPTNVGPGRVEVVEVFWLGCPHCYALEPYLQSWLKTKPAYIEFVRVPVMWGPVHRAHARLFYALQALGRSDLFEKAFDAIQQQHKPLVANSEEETLKLQQEFAKENGISADNFAKAYSSFTVNSNLQRAEQLTQRYHVEGVPLVVINGKYTTDVAKAGSPANLISVIDDLAAAEHRH